MYPMIKPGRTLVAAFCVTLASCSSTQPVAYTGIASSTYLAPSTRDDAHQVPYRYSTNTGFSTYTSIIIDPVMIYRWPDNQFGSLPEPDKTDLANYMQAQFAKTLATRFAVVKTPGPNTLRLKLTLSGATANTPLISPFTHVDMAGNVVNIVQAMRGHEGLAAGAVLYAVELYDATSARLLTAYVTKQYPNALNIAASFGALGAAKTGIDKGADSLLTELQ